MCHRCQQRHYCLFQDILHPSGEFGDSPRSSTDQCIADTGGTDTGLQLTSIYDKLAVAWFIGNNPYNINSKMWVRVQNIKIHNFNCTFDDFKRLAMKPEFAWKNAPAGVHVLNIDYASSLMFKHGREPESSDATTSLSYIRKYKESCIGLLVRSNGNQTELAILTAYFLEKETDLTANRIRALYAATANW